jgi:transcription initiation factor TFIIIB Brf1 subunit/transcription initiation factor TFIIB
MFKIGINNNFNFNFKNEIFKNIKFITIMESDNNSNLETSLELENCTHSETVNMDGVIICQGCGEQLDEHLLEEQYYITGKSIPRHNHKKDLSRSLYPDLESRGFPQNIIERANYYYTRIIENSIYRSKNRTAIVFVSTLRAYEDFGEPASSTELAKRFGLDRKGISKGLLLFGHVFKNELTKNHIQPIDLVPKILSDLGIKDQGIYLRDLKLVYDNASANSIDIRKAIPKSVAAGMVYYYLRLKDHPVSKTDYAKIVNLTEITFSNVATNFGKALNHPVKL